MSYNQNYNGQPRNNFSMLPPQFANLSSQQLQHLRSQPQFQVLMKNYLQRQQLANQQGNPKQTPASIASQQINQNAHQFVPGVAQQTLQTAPRQQPSNFPAHLPFNQAQIQQVKVNKGPVYRPPNSEFNPQNTQFPQLTGNPGVSHNQINSHKIAYPPKPNIPGVPVPEVDTPIQRLLSKIPLDELKSSHEWSDNLKDKNLDVPSDLLIYESFIEKESKFMEKNSLQSRRNKETMDSMIQDIKSYNAVKQLRMNAINLSNKGHLNNSIWGEGYQGYGNGVTNNSTKLVLPGSNKRHAHSPDSKLTEREVNDQLLTRLKSEKPLQLVPIRLFFDQERDKFQLRDTFVLSLDDRTFRLDDFVASMVEDYKFIGQNHADAILSSIKDQLKDFCDKPEKTMGELRIPIKIDVTINNTQLVDQIEWDILNFEENDPEEFASIMSDELNLPGEFATAISHSIREQTQLFHKALYLVGYSFDGSPVLDDEIRSHVLPSLRVNDSFSNDKAAEGEFYSVLRNPNIVPEFTPTMVRLTQLELERLDKEIERESRRKRRHNLNEGGDLGTTPGSGMRGSSSRRTALFAGRGGAVVPDLTDIPKTFRTPVPTSVLPGGVDLGVPDIYTYNEVLVHRSQIPNPHYNTHSAERIPNEKIVTYSHDNGASRFNVKIKSRRLMSYR